MLTREESRFRAYGFASVGAETENLLLAHSRKNPFPLVSSLRNRVAILNFVQVVIVKQALTQLKKKPIKMGYRRAIYETESYVETAENLINMASWHHVAGAVTSVKTARHLVVVFKI